VPAAVWSGKPAVEYEYYGLFPAKIGQVDAVAIGIRKGKIRS